MRIIILLLCHPAVLRCGRVRRRVHAINVSGFSPAVARLFAVAGRCTRTLAASPCLAGRQSGRHPHGGAPRRRGRPCCVTAPATRRAALLRAGPVCRQRRRRLRRDRGCRRPRDAGAAARLRRLGPALPGVGSRGTLAAAPALPAGTPEPAGLPRRRELRAGAALQGAAVGPGSRHILCEAHEDVSQQARHGSSRGRCTTRGLNIVLLAPLALFTVIGGSAQRVQ